MDPTLNKNHVQMVDLLWDTCVVASWRRNWWLNCIRVFSSFVPAYAMLVILFFVIVKLTRHTARRYFSRRRNLGKISFSTWTQKGQSISDCKFTIVLHASSALLRIWLNAFPVPSPTALFIILPIRWFSLVKSVVFQFKILRRVNNDVSHTKDRFLFSVLCFWHKPLL